MSDASDTTRRLKARALFASYLIQKQQLNGGCINRLSLASGNSRAAGSLMIDIRVGERFTTGTELAVLEADGQCPTATTVIDNTTIRVDVLMAFDFATRMMFTGYIESDLTILARGVVWNTTGDPTLADTVVLAGTASVGMFTVNFLTGTDELIYARGYATTSVGTTYSALATAYPQLCLVAGTEILMADGTFKLIEDITYEDLLAVWDFDEGQFEAAKPLWIKIGQTAQQYNLLEFSDGSQLKTIDQHRIYNADRGQFTYPMTDDTPIGTRTFSAFGDTEVYLVNKSIVYEPVDYYNIVTDYHMNMFANGILTSCRYNNIYPIVDMQFVKDERALCYDAQGTVSDEMFVGLRLAEQTIGTESTIKYVDRMEALRWIPQV